MKRAGTGRRYLTSDSPNPRGEIVAHSGRLTPGCEKYAAVGELDAVGWLSKAGPMRSVPARITYSCSPSTTLVLP